MRPRAIAAASATVAVLAGLWSADAVSTSSKDLVASRLLAGWAIVLTTTALVVSGIWFLRLLPPRLKPGQRIINESELAEIEECYRRANPERDGRRMRARGHLREAG